MAFIDQTQDFRSLIAEGSKSGPSKTRPKPPRRQSEEEKKDSFLKEAYQIIRKPYLSTAEAPPLHRRRPGAAAGDDDTLKRWENTKYLSDRERDEIDVRAKMILRRCRERVGQLEQGEKARQERVIPQNKLYKFLPSLAPTEDDSGTVLLTAHRASVLWTLNSLLARLTTTTSDLQEERAKRRAERQKTLGGSAEREALLMEKGQPLGMGQHFPNIASMGTGIIPENEPRIEEQLSQAQLQEFESENSALLEHMQSQLDSVLSAEKSLVEISQMQAELVRHLTQQTEMVDLLYDQAVASVGQMGDANRELRKARENSGQSRLMLLVFLLGMSFALLFLNWYS
ncbi:hypothetical protein A1Q2_00918 [Trichosporon asahii var. asahii CBS 8904]|uniref:t-SNARE coiled-coil homology domain-containing protein n=2 Tax=Trichosporon asahii var. asahii TaxID=189963 RepID=K1VZ13_TRIAC|nr:hypothetical protein A1Q1_05861 [Trichosporon asahii var. asahii CBS 2479]EJT45712.1 hypothetical protein A1Q1_05861 [Trichosporon asahii var. asahii CBS 2479]EKD04807.1 hypothetical protein A1Q2_00918 [Trichosporon asahii var. asahii CBS 8904]